MFDVLDSKLIITYHDGFVKKCWRSRGGFLHRLDGPAMEFSNGHKEWWSDGRLHRLDGPAIEWADGSKEWWVNHQRHRLDGPAIVCVDGRKEWWMKNQRHRLDGPAVEDNGLKEWFVHGNHLTKRHYICFLLLCASLATTREDCDIIIELFKTHGLKIHD